MKYFRVWKCGKTCPIKLTLAYEADLPPGKYEYDEYDALSWVSSDLYNITGLLGLSKKCLKNDDVSRGNFSHSSDR